MFTVTVTEVVLQKQNYKAVKVEDTNYLESNKKKTFYRSSSTEYYFNEIYFLIL